MAEDAELSISRAVESLALALGKAGAVPRGELVRSLERAAERLRSRAPDPGPPTDVLSQAEAARLIGVSRQTVNQWVRKGILPSYVPGDGTGRRAPLVSMAEISIAANRGRAEPFSTALLQQLTAFLDALARIPAVAPTAEVIGSALEEGGKGLSGRRSGDAGQVLREFLIAAMGTAGRQQEFTRAGVQMLADLQPSLIVSSDSGFGRLLDTLGLLIHSSDGSAGFDSPSAAILALLGAATVGARVDEPQARTAEQVAATAARVWGEDWVRRLFDAAYHADEMAGPPLTRYTAPLVYLGCNRFMRQAQADGISITYAASPGAILPQSYHGAPVLAEMLAGRGRRVQPWQFKKGSEALGPALRGSTKSPFRVFNFEYGLLDSAIHGIRRYCFSMERAREEFRTFTEQLPREDRAAYHELAIETLAYALEKPFVEMAAVESPAAFDWWKDHITRSSPRETVIGLRGEKARTTAHALLVRASALPQILDSGAGDPELRERLRVYIKNLNYDIIDERYRDDLGRGITRIIKAGAEYLSRDQALIRAEGELRRMTGDRRPRARAKAGRRSLVP
jgi:excisionase family DNA binding protein